MDTVHQNKSQIKQPLAEAGELAKLAHLKITQSLTTIPGSHRERLQRLGEIQGVLAVAFAKLSRAFSLKEMGGVQ